MARLFFAYPIHVTLRHKDPIKEIGESTKLFLTLPPYFISYVVLIGKKNHKAMVFAIIESPRFRKPYLEVLLLNADGFIPQDIVLGNSFKASS